ncbi:MAG TPA: hypothetical protein VNX68_15195, partial [Nitrosopumilaceae archaeon]|nr:hypothetical protein [Nitrosopumilaceae archaeon]
MNNLIGIGNRLTQTDANGNISSFTMGASNQYLSGNGTWINFPAIPPSLWNQSGSSIYFNAGSVGIGTNNPNPAYLLDIAGDAHVNNLFVSGGVLISQKITASQSLKTDSIHSYTGETNFTSLKVKLANQFQVVGNSLFQGTVTSPAGYLFAPGKGITYSPANGTQVERFLLGNGTVLGATCLIPNANPWFTHFGWIQSVSNPSTGTQAALTTGSAPWDGSGIIEVEGTDQFGHANNGLLVNYFCGRNTLINTNNALANRGGIIYMGEQVAMAKNVKIGYDATKNIDPTASLSIWQENS